MEAKTHEPHAKTQANTRSIEQKEEKKQMGQKHFFSKQSRIHAQKVFKNPSEIVPELTIVSIGISLGSSASTKARIREE